MFAKYSGSQHNNMEDEDCDVGGNEEDETEEVPNEADSTLISQAFQFFLRFSYFLRP